MAAAYRIQTLEGMTYGPAPREVVEQWIREGRVAEGMVVELEEGGGFSKIGEHPDFVKTFELMRGVPRPTHVPGEEEEARGLAVAAEGEAGLVEEGVRPYSGHAIASFLLALAGMFVCPVVPAVVAIVLGLKARRIIAREGLGGMGLANAGLVIGCIALPAGLTCTGLAVWGLIVPG